MCFTTLPANGTASTKMRLISFDYFRGIAILFIVAGHSYGPWAINTFSERMLANIISGGTALFVFISGFFFHHVFYEKFSFKKFLGKKSKSVFIPYLLLSSIGIFYYFYSSSPFPYSNSLKIENLSSWIDYASMVGAYLWTGRIATAYWYIPFILIIFTMSPVFILYIRFNSKYRIIIFMISLLFSIFLHRPTGNLSPLHSVLYFLPIYMLGIICSLHRKSVIDFTKSRSIAIGSMVFLLSFLQALFYTGHGNFHKDEMFSYEGPDIIIIQKIAMCFFFLSILQRYESKNIPVLNLLASGSFAIFFLHPWILIIFENVGGQDYLDSFLPGIGVFFVTVPIVLIGSLLVAGTLKLGLKRSSRYVTGW